MLQLYNLLLEANIHIKPLFANLRNTLSSTQDSFSSCESVYVPFNIIIQYTLSTTLFSIMQEYADQKNIPKDIDNSVCICILAEAIKYCGTIDDPDTTVKLPKQLTELVKNNEDFIKEVYQKFGLTTDEIEEFLFGRSLPSPTSPLQSKPSPL